MIAFSALVVVIIVMRGERNEPMVTDGDDWQLSNPAKIDVTSEQYEAIRAWAYRTPEVKTAILYGCRATGTARPFSDIDLALELSTSNPKEDLVSQRMGWETDLMAATSLVVRIDAVDEPAIADALVELGVTIFSRVPEFLKPHSQSEPVEPKD
jgi:predicted nucleotidyltransferase